MTPNRILFAIFCPIFSRCPGSFSVSRRGGRNKGGRKQMRANANKRRQTLTNASKRRGEDASKRKQTRANVDKRKQTLTPPFIAVFYTPLCNPLSFENPSVLIPLWVLLTLL